MEDLAGGFHGLGQGMHTSLCVHCTDQNLVTWPPLAARSPGIRVPGQPLHSDNSTL